ncbi:MAG: hypothetical protein LBB82_03180, partial [Treponema sp.]|nr:hypothetical protein [Treponema sp.]
MWSQLRRKNENSCRLQLNVYKKVLKRYGSRPVTLRTLDIGGDKTLQSMDIPREDNPFLGNRALRFCFSHPDIFKTQLRAALRASAFGSLWLMLPMVGGIDDIRRAAAMIAEVKAELDAGGLAYSPDFKTGVMIEIPAIALMADLAAREKLPYLDCLAKGFGGMLALILLRLGVCFIGMTFTFGLGSITPTALITAFTAQVLLLLTYSSVFCLLHSVCKSRALGSAACMLFALAETALGEMAMQSSSWSLASVF